ncbi:MAG: hypothetical protein LIP01_07245 [Tannerellaceae bacterium]|nr:hypothetical protein [Tannerellaceae bacterium]
MKNRKYILLILLFLPAVFVTGQTPYRERAYVQTDKSVYLAGELLWMKMYVTDTQFHPSDLSKVGYVELLDEESDVVQVKIELTDGTGEGWMELPVTLPTGHYRLVGYTWYMQNEGEEVYFNKEIAIINTFRVDRTLDIASSVPAAAPAVKPLNTLRIVIGKQAYTPRSAVHVELEGLPQSVHPLSVSVAGNGLEQASGISTTIQSWRNEQMLAAVPPFTGRYLPEYEGHIIRGRLVNTQTGEGLYPEDRVTSLLSFTGPDICIFGGQPDQEGNVKFHTSAIRGRHEAATSALSFLDNTYRVDVVPPFATHTPKPLAPFVLHEEWETELLERSVGLQVLHAFMSDSMSQVAPLSSYFPGKPDRTYDLDEYNRFQSVEETIIEFIVPLRVRRVNNQRRINVMLETVQGFSQGTSLVLLDGIPLEDHEVMLKYDPYLLKKVDVYRGQFISGSRMYMGIAAFYTYRNDYPGLVLNPDTQLFDYDGTQEKRYFYQPDYTQPERKNSRLPDYRHTLAWIPGLDTPAFTFFTSDLKGEYTITVEGITKDGQLIFASETIKVH